jgi:DNA ligase-1
MSEILFSDVAALCASLERERSRNAKKEILRKYLTSILPSQAIEYVLLFFLGVTSFSDYESTIFFIDEKEIVVFLAAFYKQSDESIAFLKKEIGDVGSLAQHLATPSFREDTASRPLPFLSVFSSLKRIATIRGKDSRKKKQEVLAELCESLEPVSVCFLLRFLLGKLRIGIHINTILDVLYEIALGRGLITDAKAIAKDLFRYVFALRRDIGIFLKAILENDLSFLKEVRPVCGSCIIPQAAEVYIKKKTQLDDMVKYVVQPKLDGFRLQVHIQGDLVHFFSRNCLEATHMFPDLCEDMQTFFSHQNNVDSVILDGELIAFDDTNNTLLSFEETARRKRVHDIVDNKELRRIKYIAFDILLKNDISLLDLSYEKRLSILKQFTFTSTVECIDSFVLTSLEDLEENFAKKTEEGYEGVLIKDKDSIYEPGKRTKTWLKYKAVQKDSLEDSFDLVILGFNQAKGNRKNNHNIGSLLVGVYCEKRDSFYSVAQVGSGGSSEEWLRIEALLKEKTVLTHEENIFINKKHQPDTLVTPHYIVSVKADTVTKSKDHTYGYSLRFPRFISLRLDKNKFQTSFYYTL